MWYCYASLLYVLFHLLMPYVNLIYKKQIKYFLNVNGAPFTFFYISKTNKINKLVNEVRSDESKRRKSIIFT